jgi:hypothetical protein
MIMATCCTTTYGVGSLIGTVGMSDAPKADGDGINFGQCKNIAFTAIELDRGRLRHECYSQLGNRTFV